LVLLLWIGSLAVLQARRVVRPGPASLSLALTAAAALPLLASAAYLGAAALRFYAPVDGDIAKWEYIVWVFVFLPIPIVQALSSLDGQPARWRAQPCSRALRPAACSPSSQRRSERIGRGCGSWSSTTRWTMAPPCWPGRRGWCASWPAARIESAVLTERAGTCALPGNVAMETVPRPGRAGAIGRRAAALGAAWRLARRERVDAVFVHMAHRQAYRLWPVFRVLRLPVLLWYAHGAVTWHLRLAIAPSTA
jgi:hypothetical protein